MNTFVNECLRVLRITKKPDKVEYSTVVKVAGLGILAIGLIGFLIFIVGYGVETIGF